MHSLRINFHVVYTIKGRVMLKSGSAYETLWISDAYTLALKYWAMKRGWIKA